MEAGEFNTEKEKYKEKHNIEDNGEKLKKDKKDKKKRRKMKHQDQDQLQEVDETGSVVKVK